MTVNYSSIAGLINCIFHSKVYGYIEVKVVLLVQSSPVYWSSFSLTERMIKCITSFECYLTGFQYSVLFSGFVLCLFVFNVYKRPTLNWKPSIVKPYPTHTIYDLSATVLRSLWFRTTVTVLVFASHVEPEVCSIYVIAFPVATPVKKETLQAVTQEL